MNVSLFHEKDWKNHSTRLASVVIHCYDHLRFILNYASRIFVAQNTNAILFTTIQITNEEPLVESIYIVDLVAEKLSLNADYDS